MSADVTIEQLASLAAQAKLLGFDEVGALKGTAELVAHLHALPGAKQTQQPWYSTVDHLWYVLTSVTAGVNGVTFTALHKVPATADDLAAVRKLWSVPQ